jgi:hypothetical protein
MQKRHVFIIFLCAFTSHISSASQEQANIEIRFRNFTGLPVKFSITNFRFFEKDKEFAALTPVTTLNEKEAEQIVRTTPLNLAHLDTKAADELKKKKAQYNPTPLGICVINGVASKYFDLKSKKTVNVFLHPKFTNTIVVIPCETDPRYSYSTFYEKGENKLYLYTREPR